MKKAQITVFVIMGILVLFGLGILIYFRGAVTEAVEQRPLDIQPVVSHITHCLDMTATDALDLVGKQGGYIYTSQGGLTPDPTKYVLYWYCPDDKEYKVYMDIEALLTEGCGYPRVNYPYHNDQCEGDEDWETTLGKNNLPQLEEGPHNIKSNLESYINNNLKRCLDFSVFEDFIIDAGDVSSSVLIAKEDVTVFIYFPITITGRLGETKSYVDEFTIKENVRLRMVYEFVRDLVRNDLKDPRYDKNGKSTDEGNIRSKVFWNVNSLNNLLWVEDIKSRLKFREPYINEIYKFWAGVENRQPVLGCIPEETFAAYSNELLVSKVIVDLVCIEDCCFDDPDCSCCDCEDTTYEKPVSGVIEIKPVEPHPDYGGWEVDDLQDEEPSKWCCEPPDPPPYNTILIDDLKYYSVPETCGPLMDPPCIGNCGGCYSGDKVQEVTVTVKLEDEAEKFDCEDVTIMCTCTCPSCTIP